MPPYVFSLCCLQAPPTHQHLAGLRRVQVCGDLNTEALLQARDHADTAPRGGKVDLDRVGVGSVGMVLDLVAPLGPHQEVMQDDQTYSMA